MKLLVTRGWDRNTHEIKTVVNKSIGLVLFRAFISQGIPKSHRPM